MRFSTDGTRVAPTDVSCWTEPDATSSFPESEDVAPARTCSSSAIATRTGPAVVRMLGGGGASRRQPSQPTPVSTKTAGSAAVTAMVSSFARMMLSSSTIAASVSVFILCTCSR